MVTTEAPAGGIELRGYQRACLDALVREARGGQRRMLVALPTGTGKTVIFAQMIPLARGKVLVLAHREELLEQAQRQVQAACPGVWVDIEQAERAAAPAAKVVVASVQTLAMSPGRLARLGPDQFSLVIVDEAHHAIARSYVQTLATLGLAPEVAELSDAALQKKGDERVDALFRDFRPDPAGPALVGFTATPTRTDGRGLDRLFDTIAFSRTIREMIEEGWLAPIRGMRVETGTDITGVRTKAGDFAERDLSRQINTEERNRLAVQAYRDYADDRQALVFAADVEHAQDLAEAFRQHGYPAEAILGITPSQRRREAIAAYQGGELRVLTNNLVLTEGFDAPETGALLMARPTKSSLLYTQMLGRGTRLAEGKADLLVIDLVDVARAGVASLNTLFGLPPKFQPPNGDPVAGRAALDEYEGQLPMEELLEATTLEEVRHRVQQFNPLRLPQLPQGLGAQMAWIKASFGYVLSVPQGPQLGVVEDMLGHASLQRKELPGLPTEIMGTYPSAREAIRAGEEYVEGRFSPRTARMLRTRAHWRSDPASPAQKRFLTQLGVPYPKDVTKGQAADAINFKQAQIGLGLEEE